MKVLANINEGQCICSCGGLLFIIPWKWSMPFIYTPMVVCINRYGDYHILPWHDVEILTGNDYCQLHLHEFHEGKIKRLTDDEYFGFIPGGKEFDNPHIFIANSNVKTLYPLESICP